MLCLSVSAFITFHETEDRRGDLRFIPLKTAFWNCHALQGMIAASSDNQPLSLKADKKIQLIHGHIKICLNPSPPGDKLSRGEASQPGKLARPCESPIYMII